MAGIEPRSRATTLQFGVVRFAATGEAGAGLAVQANDERLAGSVKHAKTHKKGGNDVIALDELADPTDNTNGDATTAHHGLMSKADKVKLNGISSGGGFSVQATVPGAGVGANGDACMVLATKTFYYKTGGAWIKFGHVAKDVTDADAVFATPTAGDGSATLDTL